MGIIRTIVVPHDFSEHANAALAVAVDLARQTGADLHLIHVIQPPGYAYASEFYIGGPLQILGVRKETEIKLWDVAKGIPEMAGRVDVSVVEGNRVADTLDREAASLGADLIAMGTHGRTGLAHLLLGSVAEQTLRHAPCPVLTVPLASAPVLESLASHSAGVMAPAR